MIYSMFAARSVTAIVMLVAIACGPAGGPSTSGNDGGGGGGTLPHFAHAVIVVEENTDFTQADSAHMPYLHSLMTQYGYATQYYANTHPSIGNYFVLTAGQIIT